MTQSNWALFLSGVLAMGYAVAALYFLKFWRQTGDRLFAYFAASFALLVFQRVALSGMAETPEDAVGFYVVRLIAFALIAAAVVDKNRRG
jgi:4-amino-4-deoxy-L-arabinose transferase-like glycosyltransferase